MPFQSALQHYAEQIPWKLLTPYGEYKELQETGKLLLGCEGSIRSGQVVLNPNKPVYIDFDVKSNNPPAIVCMGRKGSGKTILVMNIIHQLYRMYDCHIFIIDPKASLASHKQPQDREKYITFLMQIGIPPAGLPLKLITPHFLGTSPKYKDTDIYYSIGMDDFNRIQEFSVRKKLMESILGLKDNEGSIRKLNEVLSRNPQNFDEMIKATKQVNNSNAYYRRITVFDTNLKRRIESKVLADNESVDIVELMQENIVALQCSLMQAEGFNATYVAFALAQIKEGFEAGRFKKPVAFLIDEADVLNPSGALTPPSKPFLEQMSTKWRSDGAIPISIVQDPSKLSETTILQADYVLTPRIGYGTSESRMIAAHFPTVNTFELSRLHYGKGYPKEWVVIDVDGNVTPFYPIYCPSMMSLKE